MTTCQVAPRLSGVDRREFEIDSSECGGKDDDDDDDAKFWYLWRCCCSERIVSGRNRKRVNPTCLYKKKKRNGKYYSGSFSILSDWRDGRRRRRRKRRPTKLDKRKIREIHTQHRYASARVCVYYRFWMSGQGRAGQGRVAGAWAAVRHTSIIHADAIRWGKEKERNQEDDD